MASETFGSITVISDVGPTANSYSSVANIKAQWDKNPNIDYSALSDEQIGQLAIFATESIDLQYGEDYNGLLYDESYALFFPRVGVSDRRAVPIIDYTIFPSDLANAVAAQAWWLNEINFIGMATSTTSVSGVKRKEMEGLGSKEYFNVADQMVALRKSQVSSDAKKWLSSFVIGGLSDYTQMMYRG